MKPIIYKKLLRKRFLLKNNEKGQKNQAGRNNSGKITVKNLGGGHKKKYKKLNFFRTKTATGITWYVFLIDYL